VLLSVKERRGSLFLTAIARKKLEIIFCLWYTRFEPTVKHSF